MKCSDGLPDPIYIKSFLAQLTPCVSIVELNSCEDVYSAMFHHRQIIGNLDGMATAFESLLPNLPYDPLRSDRHANNGE